MNINDLPIGGRAKKYLLALLEENNPDADLTVEAVLPYTSAESILKASGKNIGKKTIEDLLKALKPYWEKSDKQTSLPVVTEEKFDSNKPAEIVDTEIFTGDELKKAACEIKEKIPEKIKQEILPQNRWSSPAEQFEVKPVMRSSGLNQYEICPKTLTYAQYKKSIQEDNQNKYTSTGRLAHEYLADKIQGQVIEAESHLETLSVDIQEKIREFWRYLKIENVLPCLNRENLNPQSILLIEKELHFELLNFTITGHLDYGHVDFSTREAVLSDWKFYNDSDMLPLIENDWQMLAYALGLRQKYNIEKVTVYRFHGYFLRYDKLELDIERLNIGAEALAEVVSDIWQRRDIAFMGYQCKSCFHQDVCQTYRRHLAVVTGTTPLARFDVEQFQFNTDEDVRDFLIAAKALEGLIAQGTELAKLYCKRVNRGILDPISNKEWAPVEQKKSYIQDVAKTSAILSKYIGKDKVWSLLKISRTAIDTAMRQRKIKKEDRLNFFDTLKKLGLMKEKYSEKFEWHHVVTNTEQMHQLSQEIRKELARNDRNTIP